MQLVNVFFVNIAHCYIFKSLLDLCNGNAFTEAENGSRQFVAKMHKNAPNRILNFKGRGEGKGGVGKGDTFWSPHFLDQSYAPAQRSVGLTT